MPLAITPDKPAALHALAISAGATLIATAGDDGLVRLWDAGSFKLLEAFSGHDKPVYGLDLGGSGLLITSAGFDGKVRIWDVGDRKLERGP